jgi:ABC-type transport system involved in multi-copper enzyme maturation permease subunit
MLWYKAWAESRARFAIAVMVMALACTVVVGGQDPARALFRGIPRTLYILFALLLGMGGLVREQELGTAALTLALPVSRIRLTGVRAMVAFAELTALSLVPLIVVSTATVVLPSVHVPAQVLTSCLRWVLGGTPLMALCVLASSALAGEYTAFVASFGVFFVGTVTIQFTRLSKPWTAPYLFTLQEVMSGIHPATLMVWVALTAVSAALLMAAFVYTERRDF